MIDRSGRNREGGVALGGSGGGKVGGERERGNVCGDGVFEAFIVRRACLSARSRLGGKGRLSDARL